jgi:hypothetical protein
MPQADSAFSSSAETPETSRTPKGELFDVEAALRSETNQVHSDKLPVADAVEGEDLYRILNERNSSALCLSGGGIRSASFALGVIEALAVHPRPAPNQQEQDDNKCLLRQFNYLSTVSGGGYIGSWLSAWISRAGFPEVRKTLLGWRPRLDEEPAEIAWLRSYSNYLTPRTGLFSADTWAAISLYGRNLVLNWLVILPALCAALLAVKVLAAGGFWLSLQRTEYPRFFVAAGVILMMFALRFGLNNRPSADPSTIATNSAPRSSIDYDDADRAGDPHLDETARTRAGATEGQFFWRCLLPALGAALFISMYLLMRAPKLAGWSLSQAAFVSLLAGMFIYALGWLAALPPWTWVPGRDEATGRPETRGPSYWVRDFFSWIAGGGVYGAMIGVGIHIIAKGTESDASENSWVWLLTGNADVDHTTAVFLLAFIYGVPWIVTAQLTAEMIFVGLTSWQPYSDSDREWFGRSTGWFSVSAFFWFAASVIVLVAGEFLLWLIAHYPAAKYGSALLAGASALFSTFFGQSSKTKPAASAEGKSSSLMAIALPVAAVVFLLLLVIAISVVMDHLMFDRGLIYSSLLKTDKAIELTNHVLAADEKLSRQEDVTWFAIAIVVVAIVAFFAWRQVNINRFSAHSMYRNRLIRAYLGASNPKRAPNPFTGFDEADNIRMAALWPARKGASPPPRAWQPFHVVNTALNVVNSKRLAWQERKAESFTMTPLHCGASGIDLGYRSTREYADKEGGGLTLGTALAISGAAASPNMGYNSSPIVTLLLALFNVRLGWWLGNPGPKGAKSYGEQGPANAIKPFISEMFGLTTDDSEYVYLSDGGHFENLALYEMVRRRCRCIVVSDAGCDPNYAFADLGNAVRKISIDLGVEVTFGRLRSLKARAKDNSAIEGAYYAIGEIDYSTAPGGGETGYILYIKPGYHGTESAGIVAYATANAAFPHESTADQFFSESQFESYRKLGFEIMDGVLKNAAENVDTIADAGILTPAPRRGKLCDLIRALDPELLRKAEAALKPPPTKLANVISALDENVIAELRMALRRDSPVETPVAT